MARTDLFTRLRRAARLSLRAQRRGQPIHDCVAELSEHAIRRRELLKGALLTAGSSLVGGRALARPGERRAAVDARTAIVGGGIAGLVCAYRLQSAGIPAAVFDAGRRIGGRIHTLHCARSGQAVELGGEFIDSDHAVMHALVAEFGLVLDDLLDDPGIGADRWFFDGRVLDEAEIARAFAPVALRMQADLAASELNEDAFTAIDRMSIAEWLSLQDELDPVLRALLDVAYTGEYGREIDEQSAFNLLWLIDSEQPSPFRVFGDSDERFHIRGGNDQLTEALGAALARPVELERRLVRVRGLARGGYRLSFERDGRCIERDFDKVVFALPFTQLRGVEWLGMELPVAKRQVIRELGYGTNAKLIGGFESRPWRELHRSSGSGFSDLSAQCFWDATRKQPGEAGFLTVFLGGDAGVDAGDDRGEAQMRAQLPALERIFPGMRRAYRDGSAIRAHWPSARHFEGSYACYLPGQAASAGLEGEGVGNLHFCGEHTSVDFQGYMEGAAESGERVAAEIAADLGVSSARCVHHGV